MRNFAQSGEDGTMGLLRCVAEPGVTSGDFYGPSGMTGPAVLMPEEALADAAGRALLWRASTEATGVTWVV